jgi:hypothetical protein
VSSGDDEREPPITSSQIPTQIQARSSSPTYKLVMKSVLLAMDPATVYQRIRDCREELKSLRLLLRQSQALQIANEARSRRTSVPLVERTKEQTDGNVGQTESTTTGDRCTPGGRRRCRPNGRRE